MRIYLAGPMRGYDRFNFPAFDAAAAQLRGNGYTVVSPAEHDRYLGFDGTLNTLEGFDLKAAFRWDIDQVFECDALVLLPGWSRSVGAKIERDIAQMLELPCYRYGAQTGGQAIKLELIEW